MKPSEYPEQDGRTVPFKSEDKESILARRVPEPETRYLDVPQSPDQMLANRNLTWAIVSLVLAALGFWLGLHYAGATATRTIVACLATFGIVLLLANFNVLRQRYGILLGLGLTVLLGAAIPFIEGGFRRLDNLARERLGNQPEVASTFTVPPPPPTTATAPPAPPTIPLPGGDPGAATLDAGVDEGKPTTASATADKTAAVATKPSSKDPSARELIVPPPPEGASRLIRVKEDVKVMLDGRPTIIRGGTVAPFKALSDGQVTFTAGDHEVSIDMGLVTFTGVSKEKPEEITRLAHDEVKRRYPKVGIPDSRENILFVTRVKEFQLNPEMKAVFFQDPKWPLVMAEQLAAQEDWQRADIAPEEPAEAPLPANQKPAAADEQTDAPVPPAKEPLLPEPSPVPEQASEPPPAR